MDNLLIALVIAAVAALSNWLQHRAQTNQEGQPPPHPPQPRTPPAAPGRMTRGRPNPRGSLEEELRRLIGEALPPETHPIPGAGSRPPSPPPRVPPALGHPVPPTSTPPPLAQPTLGLPEQAVFVPPPRFSESDAAFSRAQSLHESVANHLRQIDRQTERHAPTVVRLPSAAMLPNLKQLVKDPDALRQAFVTSLIFGPPKGLESSSDVGRQLG